MKSEEDCCKFSDIGSRLLNIANGNLIFFACTSSLLYLYLEVK